MNTIKTSKEDILAAMRSLAARGQLTDISIRSVAKASGIAVGSVYNYFPSKDELITSFIEDVWKSILSTQASWKKCERFIDSVQNLYASIRLGSSDFPSFFALHGTGFGSIDPRAGKEIMERYHASIKAELVTALEADEAVRTGIFNSDFTREDFVSFVFSNMLTSLAERKEDCGTLTRIVNLTLYRD